MQVDSPEIIRLRELSRFEDELKAELRRTTNRLWQQLNRYYPQALALSPAADDLFIWDLLQQAPTPTAGSKLSLARIERLLSSHRITRFTAEEVKNVVLQTPALNLAKGAAEAASEHVLLLLPQVTLLDQQLREVGRRIKQVLKTLEQIIGNPDETATLCAVSLVQPGDKQSAKRKMISMRQACSPRLRQALPHWASRSIVCDETSRKHSSNMPEPCAASAIDSSEC